jgi:hypothetical protein
VRRPRPACVVVIVVCALALPVTAFGAVDPIKGHTYSSGVKFLHVNDGGNGFSLGYITTRCAGGEQLFVKGGSIKNGKLSYDGKALNVAAGANAGHITVAGSFKSSPGRVVVRYHHEQGSCHFNGTVTLWAA